jgi:hypothetical protein
MPLFDVSPDLIPKLLVVRVAVYCCPVLYHSFDEFLRTISGDGNGTLFVALGIVSAINIFSSHDRYSFQVEACLSKN